MNRWNVSAIIVACLCLAYLFGAAAREERSSLPKAAAAPLPSAAPATKTLYEKLRAGEVVRYQIIGDSIGQSDGKLDKPGDVWYSRLSGILNEKYDTAAFFSRLLTTPGGIALGGWIDYITAAPADSDPDLFVLCFGQNDQGTPVSAFGASYEALVRRLKSDYPHAEIVTLIESSLSLPEYAERIRKISAYYGLLPVDTRTAFKASGVPYASLTADGVHPNSAGYALYANAIAEAIDSRIRMPEAIRPLPASPLYADAAAFASGRRQSDWTRANGFDVDEHGLATGMAGDTIAQSFVGPLLGIETLADPDGGDFKVYVDGKLAATLGNHCPFPVDWEKYVSHTLSEGAHTVEIEASSGTVKIKSIIVSGNGEQAEPNERSADEAMNL
ncbi:SGNH/GDSL hydrolase family protein [Cohnella nanjingensis]|uniref:SGNH/GDSL hydrolase family protein n=1 Tax=Cohnella nanjingensis TaxID=1387779 RepID=A0A7X0RQ99_9BACL|nr:SGNH/GDSL hydrolase family protein [Cohnella nanjingensis]MBB6671672.1 SGNH/GDSL hydrolase family protein [Cohnella nanjingensis]